MTPLRDKLAAGAAFGTFLKLPLPAVADVLALAGFDFVTCDMEHAQVSEDGAWRIAQTCAERGLDCIVRLPEPTPGLVNRLLEAGATGIQMPRLLTSVEAVRLEEMTHFPPRGRRSVGTADRLAEYGALPLSEYLERADRSVLTVGQFETRALEEPTDRVTKHLDVAFIGPVDLTVDYGAPGRSDDPGVVEHLRKVEAAAARTGTVMGAFAGNMQDVERYLTAGYRFLAVSGDLTLLAVGARELVGTLRRTLESLRVAADQRTPIEEPVRRQPA